MIVAVVSTNIDMEFRQDNLCVDDLLIDNTGYLGSFLDLNRDIILDLLNESINKISNKIVTYRKIGKDTKCLTFELIDHFAFLELFLVILDEELCFDTTWDAFKEEYQLDCIRESWKCKYGKGNLVKEVIDILRNRFDADGIGYMTVDGPLCTPFKIR